MEVKDQITVRMKQLSISRKQLADMVEVSQQTVRYWMEGRNLPGKRHLAALEKALSFKIDFTPAETAALNMPVQARGAATEDATRSDVELFVNIGRLQPDVKVIISDLVRVLTQQQPAAPQRRAA